MSKALVGAVVALSALGVSQAEAGSTIQVTVENLSPSGGFFFTPFWVGMHNGGFDLYDAGTLASGWPGLTELAEGGDTGPIGAAFGSSAAGVAGGVEGTILAEAFAGDAPVFSPGESASMTFNVGDATTNRWFSYASMVIPSNDLFVANGNPFAHELFDAGGNFLGPVTITIFGSDVNDNGSEVNMAFGGAAFSANGGVSVDENVNIRSFFTDGGDAAYLASFNGTQTGTGDTISVPFGAGTPIAQITIVPAPTSAGLLALFGGGALIGRRRG